MKPLVSPWLIYFASRADALGTLFLIVAIIAFGACLIGFDDLTKNGFKLFISIGIISSVLTVITPTTETIYTMIVANELTSNNIQAIGKTGKDVIDYITDQVDKVVNDKEEDKKIMIIIGMEHFQDVCKKKLVEWYNKSSMIHNGLNIIKPIDLSNVFVVWSCKTLQNYKCLVSTAINDGIYAEYTYNGDKQELYEDVYKKATNTCYTEE